MDWFRGPIPQEDQLMKVPLDTGRTRGDHSAWPPLDSTGRTGTRNLSRYEVSAVVEAGRAGIVLPKPNRCQVTDMKVKGTKMDTRASIPYDCCDCDTQMMTDHHSVMTEDKNMEPRPIRMKMDCAPINGETVLIRPMNFLDVPSPRLTGGFLKLAEEARNGGVVDNQPSGMSIAHSQRSGRTGRTMIMEIEGSSPGSGGEDSRSSRTSSEVILNSNIMKPVIRLGPVGRLKDTVQPMMTGKTTNSGRIRPPGPVGQDVRKTGYMDLMAQPDPVGPYEVGDDSVSSEINEGQSGHHIQPVTYGPAGLVRTRRPVGDVMLPALQDGVRPSAGGPVGQVPDPCVQIRSKNSAPVDSHQPLVTGKLGVNVSDALNDACPPLVGDQVDRSTRLDPGGPREMFSLGDVTKQASMDPVGRPWTTGQLKIEIDETDYVRSGPTGSESDRDAETLPSVVKAEGAEVFPDRVYPSVVMGKMEPSEVMCGPGLQVNPDLVIRMGADGRTDDMKLESIKGQSVSSVVSPSSDSGVHSVDEQWECMSTFSGDSDSIQSVITVYGGVACQTDSPVVKLRNMETGGMIYPLKGSHGGHDNVSSLSTNGHNSDIADMGDFSDEEKEEWEEVGPSEDVQTEVRTICVDNNRVSSLSTNEHNSDIADMGDFSDEEEEQWEEIEPSEDVQADVRTDCVDNDASSSCERSELPKKALVVTPFDMEFHDEVYWTNFRLLAKEAFKLDNVKLAASNYPVAVKELVLRSRVTFQDIHERADRWSVEKQKLEEAGVTVESNLLYSDNDRLEDFTIPISDWCYKRPPIIPDQATDTAYSAGENADKAEGHDGTLEMDSLTENIDVCSDPDARAKLELSQTKHVIKIEDIGVNCTGDNDVTGMTENVAGDTVSHEGEYFRVSMISVEGIRNDTSVHRPVSLCLWDCVTPECETRPILVPYGDSAMCDKESLPIMTTSCFGVCGPTNQFNNTDFEWCVECVNRLLWGFLVSCVVSIVGRDRSVGMDVFFTGCDDLVSIGALLDGLITTGDAMRPCLWRAKNFKDTLNNVMIGYWAEWIRLDIPWGEDNGQVRAIRASVDIGSIRVRGRFGCWCRPVRSADWLDVRPVDGGPVGTDVGIKYIGDSFSRYQSSDAAPLTEVQDIYIILNISSVCFARLCSTRLVCLTVRITRSLEEVLRCGGVLSLCQTMDGAALANDQSGITFTADLCVPWDAPEAVVDMDSPDLISLGPFPDKVGLFGRRSEAAMSRIMKGRDCRSVRFVVPDARLVDRGFHDVTIVDMADDREPTVVLKDMTRLRELWPVEVFDHMRCHQQDLELLRKSAKKDYVQTRPMPCCFCGKVIRVDMYRHVARLHLDLVQLWRCPIAWCTTWKGFPQDCLEHVRSGHDAPWIEKTASIEKYAPPWTVSRQLWLESLRIEHSGISTDMLLFSEVGMPLTQHYRVYNKALRGPKSLARNRTAPQ